jgi:hypothetical protein
MIITLVALQATVLPVRGQVLVVPVVRVLAAVQVQVPAVLVLVLVLQVLALQEPGRPQELARLQSEPLS